MLIEENPYQIQILSHGRGQQPNVEVVATVMAFDSTAALSKFHTTKPPRGMSSYTAVKLLRCHIFFKGSLQPSAVLYAPTLAEALEKFNEMVEFVPADKTEKLGIFAALADPPH
jgi:hypothetical protein